MEALAPDTDCPHFSPLITPQRLPLPQKTSVMRQTVPPPSLLNSNSTTLHQSLPLIPSSLISPYFDFKALQMRVLKAANLNTLVGFSVNVRQQMVAASDW
jgi:hypothetical protein